MKTDVLICGAGPTGLALAVQLIRYDVDFVIIDEKETTTPYSKAIGVQARTLEIYEQIGLTKPLISLGAIAEKARMIVGGRVRGEVEFGQIGKGLSPYPYILIVEQGKHETLLYEYIRSHGKDVLWQTELESFRQDDSGVRAEVKTASGAADTIEAKYLVGCDGAKSLVRHSLGLKFEGSTFERTFYVADVDIDWKYGHDALQVFLMKDQLLAFFPMTGDRQYRIVGTFPEEFSKDTGEILYEEIEQQIKRDAKLELDITKVNWFSSYRVHTRHVSKFSVGRCFLAGDSAHIHSPAGAQGMNTGIQDGYNLAWKLSAVLKGISSPEILNSYNEERLPNAEALMKTTDRFFDLVASPSPFLSFLRINIFPYVANAMFRMNSVKRFVFPRISQIMINYRRSSLSHQHDMFAIKAGDRMPYFEVEGASIYDHLREPRFHVITFFDGRGPEPPQIRTIGDFADQQVCPLYPRVADIFGTLRTFTVILRPDNYIGYLGTGHSEDEILKYFGSIFGRTLPEKLITRN
jgi:2-polyprenyl-6-methoxyphenol hydroxylase-like FAD-dependent oxidoreductase